MSGKAFYGHAPPGVKPDDLSGALIVIEGPDASGRSTQVEFLARYLEQRGYAVTKAGIKRSRLVAGELEKAKDGNILSPRTMSLFYATDFYDQFENHIVPALTAGMVVLADRYVYTLMARDLVRGASPEWVESLYELAAIPDAVFHLDVAPEALAERSLKKTGELDYWESGMDLGLSRRWYDSHIEYQGRMREVFEQLTDRYPIHRIEGDRRPIEVHAELRSRVDDVIASLPAL